MVDVSGKPEVFREAVATGAIRLRAETVKRIREGRVEKGYVFAVAKVAGVHLMAELFVYIICDLL